MLMLSTYYIESLLNISGHEKTSRMEGESESLMVRVERLGFGRWKYNSAEY